MNWEYLLEIPKRSSTEKYWNFENFIHTEKFSKMRKIHEMENKESPNIIRTSGTGRFLHLLLTYVLRLLFIQMFTFHKSDWLKDKIFIHINIYKNLISQYCCATPCSLEREIICMLQTLFTYFHVKVDIFFVLHPTLTNLFLHRP